VPIPKALESLAQTSSGAQRRLIRRIADAVRDGRSLSAAIAVQRPEVSELEIGVVAGCEKSGRMEYGMTQLAAYHGAMAAARETILKKCAYPALVLHFGILVFSLNKLIFGGGLRPYLWQVLGTLALFYGVVLVFWLLLPLLRDAGSKNAIADAVLRRIPRFGKIRRAFATSRFCATYGVQLDAGINVINALEAAQGASLSGLMRQAVHRAIPEVRNGSPAGPLLAASGAFPEPMTRAVCVGEQTGKLDEELTRVAAEYQAEAFSRLETMAEWVPRLILIAVMVYVGYGIVTFYRDYYANVFKAVDGM